MPQSQGQRSRRMSGPSAMSIAAQSREVEHLARLVAGRRAWTRWTWSCRRTLSQRARWSSKQAAHDLKERRWVVRRPQGEAAVAVARRSWHEAAAGEAVGDAATWDAADAAAAAPAAGEATWAAACCDSARERWAATRRSGHANGCSRDSRGRAKGGRARPRCGAGGHKQGWRCDARLAAVLLMTRSMPSSRAAGENADGDGGCGCGCGCRELATVLDPSCRSFSYLARKFRPGRSDLGASDGLKLPPRCREEWTDSR